MYVYVRYLKLYKDFLSAKSSNARKEHRSGYHAMRHHTTCAYAYFKSSRKNDSSILILKACVT